MALIVVLRGGGDLASGVGLRLHRAGLGVLVTELPQPLVVRRRVSFAEAVFEGEVRVEDVTARKVGNLREAFEWMAQGQVPVLVDPQAQVFAGLRAELAPGTPLVLVDGRMTKLPAAPQLDLADLVIGLGPGFTAGEDCHAVVETNRGHSLGRVIWQGPAEADTRIPEGVDGRREERVLRASADGELCAFMEIGDHLDAGQLVAEVAGESVRAPFRGVLRGLLRDGMMVHQGLKIGDVDPRDDPRYCSLVSDKSLAVGGGVLEAILSRPQLRARLWD
ncbi:MAG: selenium-dependent molybdenum cofactor biosynthesis protein YqeB [Chloroflexota bacterium]